jgi:hypothetical protein
MPDYDLTERIGLVYYEIIHPRLCLRVVGIVVVVVVDGDERIDSWDTQKNAVHLMCVLVLYW